MAPERAATEAEAMVPAFAAGRTIDPGNAGCKRTAIDRLLPRLKVQKSKAPAQWPGLECVPCGRFTDADKAQVPVRTR